MHLHARGWPPVPAAAASGRMETTAATDRTGDRVARETGLTTSSLGDLLHFGMLLFELRQRTGRQAQNADEPFSILLVVAVTHGEGREVCAIERMVCVP